MNTKPRGIWASFTTECVHCRGDLTVTSGRIDFHECEPVTQDPPITLESIKFPGTWK